MSTWSEVLSGDEPSFAQSLGADFIQDDTLFNAALVSFGSFGIIHGLMIETRDLFALNALRFKVPYDATLKTAITACDPTRFPCRRTPTPCPRTSPITSSSSSIPTRARPPAGVHPGHVRDRLRSQQLYAAGMGCRRSPGWAHGLNIMGALVEQEPEPAEQAGRPDAEQPGRSSEFAPYLMKAVIRDLFRGEKTLGKTLACGVGMPANRAVEAMEIAFKPTRPTAMCCRRCSRSVS